MLTSIRRATAPVRLTSYWTSCRLAGMAPTTRRAAVTNPSLKKFAKAAESYVEQTFARFPSYGSTMGRHEFDAQLERPTLALHRAHEKLLRETLTAVEDLPELDFHGDAWLD